MPTVRQSRARNVDRDKPSPSCVIMIPASACPLSRLKKRLTELAGDFTGPADWFSLGLPKWLVDRAERLGFRVPTEARLLIRRLCAPRLPGAWGRKQASGKLSGGGAAPPLIHPLCCAFATHPAATRSSSRHLFSSLLRVVPLSPPFRLLPFRLLPCSLPLLSGPTSRAPTSVCRDGRSRPGRHWVRQNPSVPTPGPRKCARPSARPPRSCLPSHCIWRWTALEKLPAK